VISALITPTPDAYTMMLMMVPIQILYELSIWLVKLFGKKSAPAPEAA
jgi:sec-independent protein translocase protein TatC